MFKGKDYLYPNAIVDLDLKIIESNSTFHDFFINQKNWDNISVKITDLIEFENLNKFKQSLNSSCQKENKKDIFKGKIKKGNTSDLVEVTINYLDENDKQWTNGAVGITCQRINDLPDLQSISNLILQNSLFKVFVVDLNYNLIFCNNKSSLLLENLFDGKLDLGKSVFSNSENEVWKDYFDIVFSGEKIDLENNYKVKEKEFLDLISLLPLKNQEGKIQGCIVYGKDILKLKKAELSHYISRKKYQFLFESNFLGIGMLDKNINLLSANDSFCNLAGIDKNSFENIKAKDFFFGEDYKLLESSVKKIYKKEISSFTSELKFINTSKKTIYIQVSLNGIFTNKKFSGCIVTVLDISTQKEIELKEQELANLKTKEDFNLKHQFLLQQELDSRIRELTSNQLLIAQKNNLLKTVSKKLKTVLKKQNSEVKAEIRKVISSIDRQNAFDDSWEKLKIHFVKMHPSFFQTLTRQSPKVTEKDLRHCAYIKLGFSAKEASELLGTLPTSIEQARFRIKIKLNLPKGQKLSDYIRRI